jgi:hypothetical protein
MSQIIIKTPDSNIQVPIDDRTSMFKETREPIAELLIKVGKIMLRDELHVESTPLVKVCRVAQKYKIKWAGNTHKAKVLEAKILDYFERNDSLYGEGVKMKWRSELIEKQRKMFISFHSYNPAADLQELPQTIIKDKAAPGIPTACPTNPAE